MIYVANYANKPYEATQKHCTCSAYKYGADKVFEYGPNDLDSNFLEDNKSILQKSRGGGYWLWKPYIICKTLEKIKYGDYLFYVDSGSYFIRNINSLVKCMEKNGDDIISFQLPFIERQWTKKEILQYFQCENNLAILDTCQRIATFIVLKKTERTVRIMNKYLATAQVGKLITDDLDEKIQDRLFIENRHDQSIFSIIAKLEDIPVYRDPSEYGKQPELLCRTYDKAIFKEVDYKEGDYKQLLVLHRKKNVNFYVRLMSIIRSNFSWKVYRKILKIQSKVKLVILKGKRK